MRSELKRAKGLTISSVRLQGSAETGAANRAAKIAYAQPISDQATDPVLLGNRLTVDPRTLTPLVLVRIQVPQPSCSSEKAVACQVFLISM